MTIISTQTRILILDIDGSLLEPDKEELSSIAFASKFPFLYTHTGLTGLDYRQQVIEHTENFTTDGVGEVASTLQALSREFTSCIIWHSAETLAYLSSALSIMSLSLRKPVVCAGTPITATQLETAAVLFDAVLAASSPLPDIDPPIFLCSYRMLFVGSRITLSTPDSRQPFSGQEVFFPWNDYDEIKKKALTSHFRLHWMPHEEDERRAEGRVYIGCRLFYRITPRHPSLPEAMTREKADAIVSTEGEILDIIVLSTPDGQGFRLESELPEYQRYTSTKALLSRVVFDKTPRTERSDGSVLMKFFVDDHEFLSLLCDRRDPVWGNLAAFERKVVHWGTENWGGLSIELRSGNKRLYRCEVDAFAPDDTSYLTGSLYIYAISMDPEQYHEYEKSSEPESDVSLPSKHVEANADEEVEQCQTAATPPTDDEVQVGKCLECGAALTLHAGMLSMITSQGGLALVPCNGRGHVAMVRVLSQEEGNRAGFSTEVVTQQDQPPLDT